MGVGGVYYRQTLPQVGGHQVRTAYGETRPQRAEPDYSTRGVAPMVEVESGDVTAMRDSSSTELLRELDEKNKKMRLGPIALVLAVLMTVAAVGLTLEPVISFSVATVSAILVYFAFRRDALAKTVVLFYGFDALLEQAYGRLHESASNLAACVGCWHIAAEGIVHDRKYHAGASSLVDRKPTRVTRAAPPFLQTNIETLSVGVGRQTLFFFPDRLLVYEAGKVGAVGYHEFAVTVGQKRFIEDSAAPSDARVVDTTWRYVNKSGGPDRRFANNRQLPVCLYDELHFTSPSGLNEIIQLSKCGIGDAFRAAVLELNEHLKSARRRTAAKPPSPRQSLPVGRNGNDLGDLDWSVIKQMLANGELSLTDYYFDAELNDWLTLDHIPEFKGAQS
jgi:hypothetical protein